MLSRWIDRIFGFDFFVSYGHADGKTYPGCLAEELSQRSFSVFLDEHIYAPGEVLSSQTLRRVRQSRRLVLVCGPRAVRSAWVRREVDAHLAHGGTPLVIEWDETLRDDPEAEWLRRLLGDTLTIREAVPRVDAPSPETVDRLIRSFQTRRTEQVRVLLFGFAAALFALLAVVAWLQRAQAVTEARRAVSARLAVESALQLEIDPQRAVELSYCAVEAAPLLSARESLVAAVRRAWAVERLLAAPSAGSLREAVVIPKTGVVVAGGETGVLWFWQGDEPRAVTIPDVETAITAVALTSEGRLVVGAGDGSLAIFNAGLEEPPRMIPALHGAGITRILALDGGIVATVGYDSELLTVDTETGTVIGRAPRLHTAGSFRLGIQDAAYDPVRRRVVTAGADGRLAAWTVDDVDDPRLLATFEPRESSVVGADIWFAVAIEPHSGLVAAGDGAGRLRFLRYEEGRLETIETTVPDPPPDSDRLISGLAFDPTGAFLAVTRWDGTLSVWDAQSDPRTVDQPGRLLVSRIHGGPVNRVRFVEPGIAVSAGDDGRVAVWDLEGARWPVPWRPARGSEPYLVLSDGGDVFASWDERNVVTVARTGDHTPIAEIRHDPDIRIWTAALSADGEFLAVGDEAGIVTVWKTRSSELLGEPISIHTSNVTALAFDPLESRWLLSGATNGEIVVTELGGTKFQARLLARLDAQVSSLAASLDGSVAAAAARSGRVHLWKTGSWAPDGTLAASSGSMLHDVALDSSGDRAVLAEDRGRITLYRRNQGNWRGRSVVGHSGPVLRVRFSPDGHRVASGGMDGRLVVWSAEDGERRDTVPWAYADRVEAMAWREGATEVIVGGSEGVVVAWPVSLEWWNGRAQSLVPAASCPD